MAQRLRLIQSHLAQKNKVQAIVERPYPGVGYIRFQSKSKYISLSYEFVLTFQSAILELERDPSIKVIVQGFQIQQKAVGANLDDINTITAGNIDSWQSMRQQNVRLTSLTKPLIYAVNGLCIGGCFEELMQSDIAIASTDSQFALPEVKLGLIPGTGGITNFYRIAGKSNAMRYALTGDYITAQDALRMGILSEITEGNAIKRALEIAKQIGQYDTERVIQIRELIRQGLEVGPMVGERAAMNLAIAGKKQN